MLGVPELLPQLRLMALAGRRGCRGMGCRPVGLIFQIQSTTAECDAGHNFPLLTEPGAKPIGRARDLGKGTIMEKSFSAPTRKEARQLANEWWAAQTGLRKIRQTEVAIGDDGPSLRNANRWTVTVHYKHENSK